MPRFGDLGQQYFDNAGDPLINGKIYFYESGTTTLKDTFADVNLSIINANPVLLTAAGRQPNIFFDGTSRAVLTDQDDIQIEVRDPVGGEFQEGVFSPWNALTIYNIPDIVTGPDGLFYESWKNGNQGNPPPDPTQWKEIQFLGIYNANISYALNDTVKASNGKIYRSLAGSNLGNDPTVSPLSWGASSIPEVDILATASTTDYAYRTFGQWR